MMDASITNRLIAAVLALELLAGFALILAVATHERHSQNLTFDANLRSGANMLLGAVQEDEDDNVRLDLHDQPIPRNSIYRVTDENGRIIGASGSLPAFSFHAHTIRT